MLRQATLFAAVMLLAGLSFSVAAEKKEKTNPQEKIETAVPEAIKLLEGMQYEKFVKNFVAPDELKKLTAESSLEEVAEFFGNTKAPAMLVMLKAAKEEQPMMEGKKATFEFKQPIAGAKSISFKKVGKKWYIDTGMPQS